MLLKVQVFLWCFFVILSIQSKVSSAENSLSLNSEDSINIEKISKSKSWINLLHGRSIKSRRVGVSTFMSEADGEGFFLAKDGRENFKSELLATLKELRSDSKKFEILTGNGTENVIDEKNAICRFPARALFLQKHFSGISPELSKKCTKYQAFRRDVSPSGVSMVFSDLNVQTPASAFGHTFMRLHHSKRDNELTDYAVNFSATVTNDNAIIYAVMGLSGGFKGEFSVMPYFYKVREYSDFESRDLWSYDLNLAPKEIDFMMAHLWELGHTYFDYYYLGENCSYHLLGVLDAVNPEWNLRAAEDKFVIPSETIRAINRVPGLVKNITYRKSPKRKFLESTEKLVNGEDKLLDEFIEEPSKGMNVISGNLSEDSSRLVLDSAIDYLDFKFPDELNDENKTHPSQKWKYRLMASRSHFMSDTHSGSDSMDLNNSESIEKLVGPHEGHNSSRLGVSYGDSASYGNFTEIELRAAYHDILDPEPGHSSQSAIEMGRINIRFSGGKNSRAPFVDNLSIVSIRSFPEFKKYIKSMSWKFDASFERLNRRGCVDCLSPQLSFGGGASFKLLHWASLTALATTTGSYLSEAERGVLDVGPEVLLKLNFTDNLRSFVIASLPYEIGTKNETNPYFTTELRYTFMKDFDFSIRYREFNEGEEYSLGILYFL